MPANQEADGCEASSENFMWTETSLGENIWIRNPTKPTEAKSSEDGEGTNQHAYTSFGDSEGTTVSVNAYGHIMQISRYFGFGLSGFFCVEPDDLLDPYWVHDRMEGLMDMSREPGAGLRVDLEPVLGCAFPDKIPELGFMYDQWPRFIYRRQSESTSTGDQNPSQPEDSSRNFESGKSFDLSVQFFCDKGTVFQQYLIKSDRVKNGTGFELSILDSMSITGLNFLDPPTEEPEEQRKAVEQQERSQQQDADQQDPSDEGSRSYLRLRKMTESEQQILAVRSTIKLKQARPLSLIACSSRR